MRQSLNPRRRLTILATYASARLDAADPSTTIRMVRLSRLLTVRSRSPAVAAYESVDDGDREVHVFPPVDGWPIEGEVDNGPGHQPIRRQVDQMDAEPAIPGRGIVR